MVAMGRSDRRRSKQRDRKAREHEAHATTGGEGEGAGGDDMLGRVREGAAGAARYVKDGLAAVSEQVRHTAGELTGTVLDTLLDEAERLYDARKEQAVSRIAGAGKVAGRTAHALHAVKAEAIAGYVEQAADQVGKATDYLQERTLGEILEDAGDLVQRNRGLAIGGMFVAGFAVTRFLLASQSRAPDRGADERADEPGEQEEDEGRAATTTRSRRNAARGQRGR